MEYFVFPVAFLKQSEGTSGGTQLVGTPCVVQLLQHPGVLQGIMSVVGLSQELADHFLLRVTGQTEEILAQQEGIQKARHHLPELLPEGQLSQHSGEHGLVKPPCIVGRQHHGPAEGAKEGDEGGESLDQRDGVHRFAAEKQAVVSDREACDVLGALGEGAAGEGVDVKHPLSTDGRQLDDVTHLSV